MQQLLNNIFGFFVQTGFQKVAKRSAPVSAQQLWRRAFGNRMSTRIGRKSEKLTIGQLNHHDSKRPKMSKSKKVRKRNGASDNQMSA